LRQLLLYCLFTCLPFTLPAQHEIAIEGVYRGKDVFVQNPYLNVEGAFCITGIKVNNQLVIEEPATSAVKIDLSGFAVNDPVTIIVQHSGACEPRVLNPEVLQPGSSFKILQISVDDASVSWVTTGEMPGDGQYLLQKLKLDGWQTLVQVPGKGNLDNNQYSIGIEHYAGDNRFRLIYRYQGEEQVSDEFEFYADMEPISYYPENTVYDLISLSRPTDWVIKNYDGEVLLSGYGQDINVEPLPYGEFTLILENNEYVFFRPKPEIIDRPKKKKDKKNEPR